ncbi:MAG: phage portal protein [Candidatus Puniceispirillaceae bacterium]
MNNVRRWDAASPDVVQNWVSEVKSINEDLRTQGEALRARARDLEQNNDYVARYLNLVETNIIGEGVKLQSKARTNRGKLDMRVNRTIEREFKNWTYAENCSRDGRLDWEDIQRLVARSVARDGEVIVRIVRGSEFKIALYDADFLDYALNREATDGNNAIIQGIELDRAGKPVAYYLWKMPPNKVPSIFGMPTKSPNINQYERVLAEDIIHIYKSDRPNQIRGATWLAPVMIHLLMLNRYERAEMRAAEIAASKVGYYKTPTGDYLDDEDNAEGYGLPSSIGGVGFTELPAGTELAMLDPNHPVSAYSDYVAGVLRGVATGLNVTYHALSSDLTSVNFSSIRAGTIEERDNWRKWQQFYVCHLIRPIFAAWLEFNRNRLGLTSTAADATFVPRGWSWVDPVKELQSHQMAYELGVTSLSAIAASQGKDLEEVFDQRAKEKELMAEFGLEFGPVNPMQTEEENGTD